MNYRIKNVIYTDRIRRKNVIHIDKMTGKSVDIIEKTAYMTFFNNQRMKKVFDEFKNGLGVINESSMDSEGNPNGFLSLLSHTYEFIPGINYIKTAIAVIVALAVILFILKVLLF